MRAEVRAERIHHVDATIGVAPPDEMPTPVVQRPRLIGELVGIADAEPAEGNRERKAISQA
jgi:hypothetical protein